MRIRRFVRACSNSVANRMRRLTWIATLRNPRACQAIQFRKARSIFRIRNGFIENLQQEIEQAVIFAGKLSGTNIFG